MASIKVSAGRGLTVAVASRPRCSVSKRVTARQDGAWWDVDGRVARSNRRSYVRSACAGALRAVASLHAKGVVHRSLGGASLLVSTLDQTDAKNLRVKVRTLSTYMYALYLLADLPFTRHQCIDLGFAATASTIDGAEVEAAMRRGATSPLEARRVTTSRAQPRASPSGDGRAPTSTRRVMSRCAATWRRCCRSSLCTTYTRWATCSSSWSSQA